MTTRVVPWLLLPALSLVGLGLWVAPDSGDTEVFWHWPGPGPTYTPVELAAVDTAGATVARLKGAPGLVALPRVRVRPFGEGEGRTVVTFEAPICFVPWHKTRADVLCRVGVILAADGTVDLVSSDSGVAQPVPMNAVQLVDDALRASSEFGGGLEGILRHNSVVIAGFWGHYTVEVVPLSDEGHDISMRIDKGSLAVTDVVIGMLEPEPSPED